MQTLELNFETMMSEYFLDKYFLQNISGQNISQLKFFERFFLRGIFLGRRYLGGLFLGRIFLRGIFLGRRFFGGLFLSGIFLGRMFHGIFLFVPPAFQKNIAHVVSFKYFVFVFVLVFFESRGLENIKYHILSSQLVNFLLVNQIGPAQTSISRA